MGMCPHGAHGVITGVRSPPLRNGVGQREMALRGTAGDPAEGDFLGGRTLCARVARPYECRGISWRTWGAGSLRGVGVPG